MPGNAAFHPMIETVGFQTAFSVRSGRPFSCEEGESLSQRATSSVRSETGTNF
jgi:hypothetical protein